MTCETTPSCSQVTLIHSHTHGRKVTSLIRTTSLLLRPIGLEKRLQGRLSSISRSQLTNGQDVQNIADAADDVKQRQQTYETKVEEVQTLVEEMRRKLDQAKAVLRSAVRFISLSQLESKRGFICADHLQTTLLSKLVESTQAPK